MKGLSLTPHDVDNDLENGMVKVTVERDAPDAEVFLRRVYTSLPELKRGREVELPYWVARRLVEAGVCRFRAEDTMSLVLLAKIYWKETVPSGRQIAELRPNFYFLLRRFLRKLEEESTSSPEKLRDFQRGMAISQDLINSRIRKIASLAAGAPPPGILEALTPEEASLYESLRTIIHEWRESLLRLEANA